MCLKKKKKKKKIALDTLLYNQQDFDVGTEIRRSKGGRRKKKGVVSLILQSMSPFSVWLPKKLSTPDFSFKLLRRSDLRL